MHRCLNHHARTDLTACLDGSISLGLTYKPKPYINAQVMTQIMHAYRINYLDRNINSHRFFCKFTDFVSDTSCSHKYFCLTHVKKILRYFIFQKSMSLNFLAIYLKGSYKSGQCRIQLSNEVISIFF